MKILERSFELTGTHAQPARRDISGAITRNAPLVLFSSAVGITLLLVLAPSLIVADSWLTLVAGREIAEHGLPDVDHLTVIASGTKWTDQQWLAQLAFYSLERLGSLSLVTVVNVALVLSAFVGGIAAARAGGASLRATFLVAPLALVAAPWSWQVRAQTIALPLFVAVLWLLVDGQRAPRARTFAVLPLLVVWANVHGSVVLGALVTVLWGAIEVVRRPAHRWRGALFVVAAPLAVLASPYAVELPAYYRLMLIDAPFADVIREWQPSRLAGYTIVFYVLAACTAVLVALRPRRLSLFELATLAITVAGAVSAARGITWFALAALVIVPRLVDAVWPPRRPRRQANRVDSVVVVASAGLLAVAALVTVARSPSWLEDDWPPAMIAAVQQATASPDTRVYPSDRHADWLLWELPQLRGRIAYDVRFELYDEDELDRIVAFDSEDGPDWKDAADGYRVVVVDERSKPSHTSDFASEPGSRVLFHGADATVIFRSP